MIQKILILSLLLLLILTACGAPAGEEGEAVVPEEGVVIEVFHSPT